MKEGRNKKSISVRQDVLREAEHIVDKFRHYTDGIRLIMLIYRAKEGAVSANNDKYRKYIVNGQEEYLKAVIQALEVCYEKSEIPFRVYASVNSRNIEKAIRLFKHNQLDADYYDTDSKNSFYLDIKNRMISALMTPSSRAEGMFLIDCDSTEADHEAMGQLAELGVEILDHFPTKNGWHMITEPFNPTLFKPVKDVEIKKDGLLLLKY